MIEVEGSGLTTTWRASSGVVVSEAGSYIRLIESCITQLKAQGPSKTCNESNAEKQHSCPHRDFWLDICTMGSVPRATMGPTASPTVGS